MNDFIQVNREELDFIHRRRPRSEWGPLLKAAIEMNAKGTLPAEGVCIFRIPNDPKSAMHAVWNSIRARACQMADAKGYPRVSVTGLLHNTDGHRYFFVLPKSDY